MSRNVCDDWLICRDLRAFAQREKMTRNLWLIALTSPIGSATVVLSAFTLTKRSAPQRPVSKLIMPRISLSTHFPFSSWLAILAARVSELLPNILSQSPAGFIQESLVKSTQAFQPRNKELSNFYVIANGRHPAVLVEGGFLTNTDDITRNSHRRNIGANGARAVSCEGILHYRDAAWSAARLAVANPESLMTTRPLRQTNMMKRTSLVAGIFLWL